MMCVLRTDRERNIQLNLNLWTNQANNIFELFNISIKFTLQNFATILLFNFLSQ